MAVALIGLAVTYIFFHNYFPPFKRVHLWSDVAGYHYPLQRYAFDSLKHGRIPLWDPSIYCGIPFLGNIQAAFLYPPTWLLYAVIWSLPRIPFKAYEGFTLLHPWIAFFMAYLWLRGRTGRWPAVLGGSVFGFSGYMMYQVLHPGVIGAMAWMPLAFWGIDQSVEQRSWRPLWKVAASTALAFFAGYPAAWMVNCIILFPYALAGRRPLRAAVGAIAGLIVAVPLIAAQLLPTLDARAFMNQEPKYGPGAYSALTLVRGFLTGNWFDFNPTHATDYNPGSLYFYLGLPLVFAVGWAIWRHRPLPYLQPLAGFAVALILANPSDSLLRLVERFPALNTSMQPFNFYSATAAMAALFAAIALHDFLEQRSSRVFPAWATTAIATAAVVWSVRAVYTWRHGGKFPIGPQSAVYTAVALALFALCLWAVRQNAGRRRALLTAVLLVLVGADCMAFGARRWFNAVGGDVDDEHPKYGIAGFDDEAYRALMAHREYRSVTANLEGPHPVIYRIWGLSTPEGFDPFLSVQYREAVERWVPFQTNRMFNSDIHNEAMLQYFGVRFILVRDGAQDDLWLAANPNFRRIGPQGSFCHVYEYLHARPPFQWEQANAGTVDLAAWIPEHREFRVHSDGGGKFVLKEQFFTGWQATVDGQAVPIERWDGTFQAVRVAPGDHRVSFEFRPRSVVIGAIISLFTAIALAFVALWKPRLTPSRGVV